MYLKPALDLISRHSPRLDPVETMQLLPPLVTAADVKPFLVEALRGPPKLNTRVHKEIWKARTEQIGWKLMTLQEKRVKVTDSRLCVSCLTLMQAILTRGKMPAMPQEAWCKHHRRSRP